MRLLDLFSGIGGFSLAAKWVWGDDLDIVGFCEIDKYCQKVLAKHWPDVPVYEDITKLDGKSFKNIDLITGGFPCQDISAAGRGAGIKKGTRSGLWSEMHRIISDIRPRFTLIENVPMLTIRGGTGVIEDLTEIGYDTEWTIISAKDVGAWHLRKRIWIVAYPNSFNQWTRKESRQPQRNKSRKFIGNLRQDVPDTNESGLEGRDSGILSKCSGEQSARERSPFASEGNYWLTEPNVGRVADGIPSRVDRLKGIGNAIVPQVAQIIMQRIKRLIDEK
jgi:DNA (cytosine-5)-methyltransferase 1